jgi:aarF domain-containing kinase
MGSDWESKFDSFDMEPFAAASIGQVHKAVYQGKEVAVKIQYPGVATSIDSDLYNLKLLLDWTNVFPKGLYLDNLLLHMKGDLVNECNYDMEADNQREFRTLLNQPGYQIPEVYFNTNTIIISEFVHGVSIEQVAKNAP